MTLDEAIKHAEEVADTKRLESEDAEIQGCEKYAKKCDICAAEHRQLAEWLKELKAYKEQESCENCISRREASSVTPKPDNDLRESIASAVDDKMGYLNTCLNERDIILGIIRGKRYDTKSHCERDCNNTDCKSHPDYKPKTGHWILARTFPTRLYDEYLNEYECSECYRRIRCTESQLVNYPYCHCGAKMVEPKERRRNERKS